MKKLSSETYDEWCERVLEHEQKIAKKQLGKGVNIHHIMETMSRRIINKLVHPHLKQVHQRNQEIIAKTKPTEEYESYEQVIAKRGTIADHMVDED